MILAHTDSHGNRWFFKFNAPREAVARVARKLSHRADRVTDARNNTALARAQLAEAVAIADLQAYNGATPQEWDAAAPPDRYDLNTAEV